MSTIILQGDAAHLPLPDEAVDLVVTSPPYFGLRSYTDGGEHIPEQVGAETTPAEYLDTLVACTAEWIRVLKPGGSIFVNLGDKYASYEGNRGRGGMVSGRIDPGRNVAPKGAGLTGGGFVRSKSLFGLPWRYALRCMDDLGLILRSEIIWSKPNGLPESVTDRVRRSHEQVFHFVKQRRYFAAIDEIREPHTMKPQRRPVGRPEDRTPRPGRPRQSWSTAARNKPGVDGNPLGKLPSSVWSIPTSPLRVPDDLGIGHFAAYPPELVRRIVLGWSPIGGVVLDPMGGTGTTAMVADVLGRVGITVDLSYDYCRIARWRTADEKQRARVVAPRPKAPVVQLPASQTDDSTDEEESA